MSQQQTRAATSASQGTTSGHTSAGQAQEMPPNSVMQEAIATRLAELQAAQSPEQASVTRAPSPIEEFFEELSPTEIAVMAVTELVSLLDRYISGVLEADTGATADAPAGEEAVEQQAAEQESAPVTEEEAVRTADEDAVYSNQMDNDTQGGKPNHAQCGPTSLTMSLMALYDNDESALKAATNTLLAEQGQKPVESHDAEEAIIQLMLSTNWDAAFKAAPQFFEHNPNWRHEKHQGSGVIKSPFAHAYTASRYDRCGDGAATIVSTGVTIDDGESSKALDFDGRWQFALDAWRAGGEVTFEGGFTGSGHVVHIVEITDTGMVVNDPFGMHIPGLENNYLRNGKAPPELSPSQVEKFDERANGRAELPAALKEGEAYSAWGERNHFTREELKALDALKWLLVLHPEATEGE